MVHRLFALGLLLLWQPVALAAQAERWPEFRGPTGQGHSTERDVPLEWSESRNVLWKTPVQGRGWSSPVVERDRVWLTTAVSGRGGTSLRVMAYDVETGREVVNVEVFHLRESDLLNPKNSHASPTAIVEGDRVYVHFGAAGTAALTIVRRDCLEDAVVLSVPARQWWVAGAVQGFADRQLRRKRRGVCHRARQGDRQDSMEEEPAVSVRPGVSSPLVIRVGERDEVVSVGAYRAAAYDPASGEEIWRVSYDDGFSNVPRPVYGHGLVYIATGFQQPSLLAVRADGKGDVTRTHVAWKVSRGAPYTPSPLLVGDELYVVSDLGIVSCLDAVTGALHWQQRIGGNHSASPVLAAGRIYFLSEEGVTTVIAPGRTFQKLATNELDGATLASMAVFSRSMLIRTQSHLYRLGVR